MTNDMERTLLEITFYYKFLLLFGIVHLYMVKENLTAHII